MSEMFASTLNLSTNGIIIFDKKSHKITFSNTEMNTLV